MWKRLFSVGMVVLAACSAEPNGGSGSLAVGSSELSAVSLTPWPCQNGVTTWNGSTADLLVADAWTACSEINDPQNFSEEYFGSDPYLWEVFGHMVVALTTPPTIGSAFKAWYDQRQIPAENCDPVTGAVATAPIAFRFTPVLERIDIPTPSTQPEIEQYKQANSHLRQAGINFCIAQTLRMIAPGGSGGEMLLMPESEQRMLLDTVRQRVQLGMLQYGLLGTVFSTPPNPAAPVRAVSILQNWPNDPNSFGFLHAMGRDFAAAVQLHGVVSEELLQLLARSRSARSSHGGVASTRSEELWGAGSWHQRLLAAAYGGDPLVSTDHRTPWTHWNPTLGPAGVGSLVGSGHVYSWPGSLLRPYATVSVQEPQVEEFARLAGFYDRIELALNPVADDCDLVGVADSASELYANLEADVRVADCYRQNPSDPCPTSPVPPTQAFGSEPYLLFEKHRISPAHALTYVQRLAQSIGARKGNPQCLVEHADAQLGALDLAGTLRVLDSGKLKVSGDAAFTNPTQMAIAPVFTRNAALRFPSPREIDHNFGGLGAAEPQFLGLDAPCFQGSCANYKSADAKRTMGALAAVEATRQMLMDSIIYLASGVGEPDRLQNYFHQWPRILGLLDATVGPAGVFTRPVIALQGAAAVVQQDASGKYLHTVRVLAPGDDPFWECDGSTCLNAAFALQGPYLRTLATHPDSQILGAEILTEVVAELLAPAGGRFGLGAYLTLPGGRNIWAANVPLPLDCVPDCRDAYSLVAVRLELSPDLDLSQPITADLLRDFMTFRLLGNNVLVVPNHPRDAQYYATGGTLGDYVTGQSIVRVSNPSEPVLDGFGLPVGWVPPFTAELIGGSADQSSATKYLQLAKETSNEARAAIEVAMQGLIQQQQDDASLATASARSVEGVQQERDALCGANTAECEVEMKNYALTHPYSKPANCNSLPDDQQRLCLIDELVFYTADWFADQQGVIVSSPRTVALATPVYDSVNHPTAPAFDNYAGGKLQTVFIEQWHARRTFHERIKQLGETGHALKSTVNAAHAVLWQATADAHVKCSAEAHKAAYVAGLSVNSINGCSGPNFTGNCSVNYNKSAPMSLAPLHAQRQACASAELGLGPADAQVYEAFSNAMLALGNSAVSLQDAVTALQLSAAKVSELVNQASLAERRHELEVELTQFGLTTSFSSYRIYRAYDLWRAKALVENARRYGLAARRAIEARYVVDLSKLDQNEQFVASPSSWADEIYGYDLALPGAVGLTVGSASGDAIYPSKISDYVANLEGFMAGFAASRPSAVATNDVDVVSLSGLDPGEPVEIPIDPNDPNSPTITAYPDRGNWELRCPVTGGDFVWTPAAVGCPVQPDRARLLFTLDPWGRVSGHFANAPFEKRYNARWGLVAVNLVGTGIRDCKLAQDPLGCYSQPFVRYNLTHIGPSWTTSYEGLWHALNVPIGRIEGAKAIAAEIWLDPLKDGWSTSYIAPVARSEWSLRPLGGAYQLELEVTPDMRLERLQRVQFLLGSSSWVKQD